MTAWISAAVTALLVFLKNGFVSLLNAITLRKQKEEKNQVVADEMVNAKTPDEADKATSDAARNFIK